MKQKIKINLDYMKQNMSLRKIIIILSIVSVLTQIILGRIHNQAAYVVYDTVAIFSFFFVISLLIDVVNSLRLEVSLKALIAEILTKIISLTLGTLYVTKLLTDENFYNALSGELSNSIQVSNKIQASALLIFISLIVTLITGIFSVVDFIKRVKNE